MFALSPIIIKALIIHDSDNKARFRFGNTGPRRDDMIVPYSVSEPTHDVGDTCSRSCCIDESARVRVEVRTRKACSLRR